MSSYYPGGLCEKHGEWSYDVDNPRTDCPQCEAEGNSPYQVLERDRDRLAAENERLRDWRCNDDGWMFTSYSDPGVIDEDGDIIVGAEGNSDYRVIAQCVSPDDAREILGIRKALRESLDVIAAQAATIEGLCGLLDEYQATICAPFCMHTDPDVPGIRKGCNCETCEFFRRITAAVEAARKGT
ncbi:MAG: hypothetical protein AB7I42_24040 [Bradyrhizobium sp.]|uniref:hypothetical protein n=1 Tax=Bradyrhizobium sp. TaxID=376 RepID=UPI003D0A1C5F